MRFPSLILAVCLLSACAPEKPWMMEASNVDNSPMRIIEGRHVVKKPLAEMTNADIADAANIYRRGGAGPVYVVVAFDDTKGKGLDRDVNAQAHTIAEGLSNSGVTQKIIVSTMQLDAPVPVALIAFDTLTAAAPAGCDTRPSMEKSVMTDASSYDYRLGCGVKSMMAQQIADVHDLEGKAGLGGNADGERVSNIINNDYRSGVPNEFLPSYVISELAAGN